MHEDSQTSFMSKKGFILRLNDLCRKRLSLCIILFSMLGGMIGSLIFRFLSKRLNYESFQFLVALSILGSFLVIISLISYLKGKENQ